MKTIRHLAAHFALIAGALLAAPMAAAQQDPWTESYRFEYIGKYAEALAFIEPFTARQPINEFAIMRSAWLLHLQGKYAEAEKRYQRAVEVNPRSLEAKLGLMLPQMALYRWNDAIQSGRKVLADSPWNYTALVRIMICEEALSRWEDLAKHAAEASARFPTDATLLVYWARAEAALKRTRKAKELYAQVLERVPGHIEASNYLKNTP
jgi:tetratricopeptide (TPR) repeat protein